MGRHVSCLPPQSVIALLEFSAISEGINVFGIGVVKISVCLALLRVVERARRDITLFLWSLLVFVAVTHLALAMLFFLHCRPLAALWNPEVHGSCLSAHTTVLAGYVGFAVDVVTDLVCAVIPVLAIHRLQMSFRTKIASFGNTYTSFGEAGLVALVPVRKTVNNSDRSLCPNRMCKKT